MPVIYLVRHGQASYGAQPDGLSTIGRVQAAIAGVELARRSPRDPLVVCGTLDRQQATAHLLMSAAALFGEPRIDSRWDEYDHLELMRRYTDPPTTENHTDPRGTQALLDQALGKWIRDTDSGGWEAFIGAANAAIEELAAVLSEETDAIVVTSGGVLAAICGSLLSMPPAGIVALNRVMVNAAISTLVVGGSGTSLLAFNDHSHLAGKGQALLTYR